MDIVPAVSLQDRIAEELASAKAARQEADAVVDRLERMAKTLDTLGPDIELVLQFASSTNGAKAYRKIGGELVHFRRDCKFLKKSKTVETVPQSTPGARCSACAR